MRSGGKSWIETRNEVCYFVVGDKTMPSHGDGVPAQIKVLQLLIWQMKDVGDVTHLDYIHEYLKGT